MNVLAHEHEVAVIGTTFSHHTIHGLQLPIDVKAREQLLIGECGRIQAIVSLTFMSICGMSG